MSCKSSKHLIIWGSYDVGKPRVRLLVKAAEALGYKILEIHCHVWEGIEDKSQLKDFTAKLKKLINLLQSYPGLIWRYLKVPKQQDIIVPYLGLFDIFVLWPFAKLRGSKIHWDMFISLYDTVVNDRKLISRYHPLAWFLYASEWLACRMVDSVFMDTKPHALYIAEMYHLPVTVIKWVSVGVETGYFPRQLQPVTINPNQIKVLFYGQFIPLHGIDTILDAVKLDQSGHIQWTIVGKGQLSQQIKQRIKKENIKTVTFISWVPYNELSNLINLSDICLGIFGTSQKSQQVIPNKIYQIMATGKPFVTANTLGIQSLKLGNNPAVSLCEPGDAASLLEAVNTLALRLLQHPRQLLQAANSLPIIDATYISMELDKVLNN